MYYDDIRIRVLKEIKEYSLDFPDHLGVTEEFATEMLKSSLTEEKAVKIFYSLLDREDITTEQRRRIIFKLLEYVK
jgi:hypothetical protein